MGNIFSQEGKEAASTIAALNSLESPETQKSPESPKIAEKKEEIAKRKKKPKTKTKKKNSAGDEEHKHELEVEITGNAFALLADQQGQEASTIVALKIAEVNKIAEENKKEDAKKKKQKKSFVVDDKKSLDSIVEDHEGNVSDNKNQEKVSIRTVVSEEAKRRESHKQWLAREAERRERHKQWLAREAERQERHKQWLAREAERQERHKQWLAREAERKERWLAREERKKQLLAREVESENQRFDGEEEKKEEIARKTLKECEEKFSLSIPATPVREATHHDIHTKQKSEDEMVKKGTTTKNYWKVKTMNDEEFLKLATEGEGQDSRDTSICEGSLPDKQEPALPNVENTMEKAGPAFDLSETSFPVLGKVTKP